ncbi:MAG: tryptophan synthase subunit alpha [archaeon]
MGTESGRQTYADGFARSADRAAFMPFAVLGFPDRKRSIDMIRRMIDSGADMLELGFPFSDPIADGPTIQHADTAALDAGITVADCFSMITDIRELTDVPIGLLVYANLVYQRGIDAFCEDCASAGVNSVLIPDMPVEEADAFVAAAKANGLDTVFIVTELTTPRRLSSIIDSTTGFIYIVSAVGVTGARTELSAGIAGMLTGLRKKTDLPLCVGFGISKPEHAKSMTAAGADGVICGSAIIDLMGQQSSDKKALESFIIKMKKACVR